ncbi:MAG: 4Fe-4S binding protein [Syntrophorhabdus sp.]
MKKRININREVCTACGLCAEVCPHKIMKKEGEEGSMFRQDRLFLCMTCGQCMAICPSQAIEKSPALRKLFSIPDSNAVVGTIILGFPKYRYQRGIRRNLKSVTWV